MLFFLQNIEIKKLIKLSKEGSWILLGQIMSIIGSLLLIRLITEYLDPINYGKLSLGLTLAGLINQLILGGVQNGISRYYTISEEEGQLNVFFHASKDIFKKLFFFLLTLAIVGTLILYILSYSQLVFFYIIVLLFSLISGSNYTLNAIQNSARQRSVIALHTSLDAGLKILFVFLIYKYFGRSSENILISYILSLILISISQIYFLKKLYPPVSLVVSKYDSNKLVKKIFKFALPFTTWGIFTWLQQSSDRWALQTYTSTEQVGKYAALYQVGYMPMNMLSGFALTFLAPIFFKISGDSTDLSRKNKVSGMAFKLLLISLLITFTAFIFSLFFHQWIFEFLLSKSYRSASYLLPWVIIAGGFFAAGQILNVKIISDMQSNKMIKAKIITSLFGVLFNIFGAYFFGIDGVVVGLVLFSLIYLSWMYNLTFYNE
jgi:O-antigen/teichoic acid export membrane protein